MKKMLVWLGAVILMIGILMVGTSVNVNFLSDYKAIKGTEFLSGPKDIPYQLKHEKMEDKMRLAELEYIKGKANFVYDDLLMLEDLVGDHFVFKAYLKRGTELTLSFDSNLQDEGYVEFLFLNKHGIINWLKGDAGQVNMKIRKSGNYGIVLNRQSKEGTLDFLITVEK
ncbi:MAG: hypothetical protein ACRCST_06455 [Turicibacter sp.]